MFTDMLANNVGGAVVYKGEGIFTAINQEVSINTGLSNISKFTLIISVTGFENLISIVYYDADNDPNKYHTIAEHSNGAYGGANYYNLGVVVNQRTTTINSVNGGIVNLISAENSNFIGNFFWYAE